MYCHFLVVDNKFGRWQRNDLVRAGTNGLAPERAKMR
jgi:hypothetical protein